MCCRVYLSASMSSATTCWVSKPFACTVPPSQGESLHFKSLIFHSDCTNISRKWWGGRTLHTWTNTETPGVLQGYHYGSTVCTCPAWIKTKQDMLGDLIRQTLLHRLTAALSHSSLFFIFFFKYDQVSPDVQRGFSFSFFFFCKEFSGMLTLVSSAGRFLL